MDGLSILAYMEGFFLEGSMYAYTGPMDGLGLLNGLFSRFSEPVLAPCHQKNAFKLKALGPCHSMSGDFRVEPTQNNFQMRTHTNPP